MFFVSLKPNKFLLERRPSKGILGGLLGFPTTKWDLEKNEPTFPFQANWFYTGRVVTHQFSHFKLELEIVFFLVGKIHVGILDVDALIFSLNIFGLIPIKFPR